jgi:hypothetical protein
VVVGGAADGAARGGGKDAIVSNNEASPAEKLAALHNDSLRRREGTSSTLLDHVSNDSGGRYATLGKPAVIGTTPAANYPALPASSPWSHDGVGQEPPLGIEINAMEPVGEVFEVERSLAELAASNDAPIDANPTSVVESLDAAKPTEAERRLAAILPRIARRNPDQIRRRKL